MFHARSVGCFLCFLRMDFYRTLSKLGCLKHVFEDTIKELSCQVVHFIVFRERIKQPVCQPSHQPFNFTSTQNQSIPMSIKFLFHEAILNLYSRLSITVTSPVILTRDFVRSTTDNHQLNRLSLIKLTP